MRVLVFTILSCLTTALVFEKRNEESAPLLTSINASSLSDRYIVVYNGSTSESSADYEQHLSLLTSFITLSKSYGINDNEITHLYNTTFLGYAGKFTKTMIDDIRKSGVEYVEEDQVVHTKELEFNAPWGLARISHRSPLTFSTFNKYVYDSAAGSGVTAYVIDTGVNVNHVDFGGRASWGKVIPTGEDAEDHNGHGTHVAGTIAGSRYGVAKKAKIKAVKVLKSNGSGAMSDVLGGVEYALMDYLALKKAAQRTGDKSFKGGVANMSLGGGFSKSLNFAVEASVKQGLQFAVAAGNENEDACNSSPASVRIALTVGASTIGDERAWFSNYGKCVDIFGPGLDIKSTWIGSNTAVNTISGTSMASPHIAGLAAYFLSLADSAMDPQQIKANIIKLAIKNLLTDIPTDTPNIVAYNGQ